MAKASGRSRRRGNSARSQQTAPAARTNGKTRAAADAPGFVLCPARTGSTLMRLILNNHPEIACPPETNLAQVFQGIGLSVAAASDVGLQNDRNPASSSKRATEDAVAICRSVADRILGGYARANGKAMWVDKSLPSILFADLLAKVYPDARFICLYRRCTDTVASLHEASSWSYESFGVLPFVQANPANLAQALTAYWADRVTLLQAFEESKPEMTLRVLYEDLVARPEETVAQILGFLGVRSDEESVTRALAFQPRDSTSWPGDVKIRFSQGIDSSSVGRGWSVPLDMLPQALRDQVNALSGKLGYQPLPDLKRYTTESAIPLLSDSPHVGTSGHELERLLQGRIAPSNGVRKSGERNSGLLKLVLTDLPEPWMVDFDTGHVEKRDGQANWLALTDSETLLNLISGHSNPGLMLRNSTFQLVSASDQMVPDQFCDCVDELMSLLRG